MKQRRLKKIMVYSFSIVAMFVVLLALHIYMVYRPKAPDAYTRILARIDIKQQLTVQDSTNITSWLYQQKAVDHVLVNPHTNIVVFTFFPVRASANKIVNDFKSRFHFKADRFMPTAENLKSSCPVATSSLTYKIYQFIEKII
jgi:hypothetical protein